MSLKVKSPKVLYILTVSLGLLACFYIFQQFIGKRFYLNLSPSEPVGLYRAIAFDGRLQVGELVLMDVPEQVRSLVYERGWLPKDGLMLKNVGAVPGDMVGISAEKILINHRFIAPIRLQDSMGRPLPRLESGFVIQTGNFLPLATHIPNSFDGRYFGQVPIRLIRSKAVPVITF